MKLIRDFVERELGADPAAWTETAQCILKRTELPTTLSDRAHLTPLDALNVRMEGYGTRSALIATCHVVDGMRYLATEGNPSDTPFRNVTKLLGEHSTDVE